MLEKEINHRESYFHGLDPRTKVISVFTFSVIVAVINSWGAIGLALFFGLSAFLWSGLKMKDILQQLIPVNLFLLFLWFLLPFTVNGEPLFSIGPLTATYEGVAYGIRITIKSNTIMILLIVLASSTSILDLGNALSGLRIPEKIVQLLFFTYRYIHVLYMEYTRMMSALKVRVFQPKTNFHTYKTYAHLVGMLLVRSSVRAERVYNAMLCRGFDGRFHSLSAFTFTAKDRYFLLLTFMIIASLGIVEWTTIIP